jgi:hypothetical protein
VLREAKSKRVTMTEQSLYERLGGVNAIAMVIDPWGAETRSCSSSVLMEEPTEPVASVHAA